LRSLLTQVKKCGETEILAFDEKHKIRECIVRTVVAAHV
jgi:hypothetical protein